MEPSTLNVTLASSLFNLELEREEAAAQAGGRTFTTGITSLNKDLPADLFSAGDVIGIGGIQSDTKSLPLEIVAAHLLVEAHRTKVSAESDNDEPQTSVYIVAPPDQATASIRHIYQSLTSRISQLSSRSALARGLRSASSKPLAQPLDAKIFLNNVSILQYLDISGLAESLSEVFDAVTSEATTSSQRCILLVQGLTSCVTTTQRRSGVLQSAALLSSILRNIRNITYNARSGSSCLTLIELDIGWSHYAPTTAATAAQAGSSMNPSAPQYNPYTTAGGLDSAFFSLAGRRLRLNVNNSLTLSDVIVQNLNVIVAIHDADGRVDTGTETRRVVEVVRDERVEHLGRYSAIGKWTIWN